MPPTDHPVRQQGILTDWKDARGFGFITPIAGGSRVFAHVSDFPQGTRPVAGCEVTYIEGRDEHGRPRASQVRYRGSVPGGRRVARGMPVAVVVATLFFALLVGLLMAHSVHVMVLAVYALLSAVAFLIYGLDKSAAEQGARRVPESTLHSIALLGGWPGALVARHVFRHKTRKQPFRTIFWVTGVPHCLGLVWLVF